MQVSCIYGLGMPSKYLEASIRIVKGQEWTGGWTTLVQHLEQVRYLAPLVVLNTALNGDYLFIFLQRFQPLWALEHRTFFYRFLPPLDAGRGFCRYAAVTFLRSTACSCAAHQRRERQRLSCFELQ